MKTVKNIRRITVSCMVIMLMFLLINCKDDDINDPMFGKLTICPQEMLVNTETTITAQIKVLPGVTVADSLELKKISTGGTEVRVGYLLDNGNLAVFGDEIKGDKVYSGKFTINEAMKGQLNFKVYGISDNKTVESEAVIFNVYADIAPNDIKALFTIQSNAAAQLNTYLGGSQNNAVSAVTQLVNWLTTQPEVKTVEQSGITNLEIEYKSGLRGGIIISLLDDDGLSDSRGGILPESPQSNKRQNTSLIPISRQTRGENFNENKGLLEFGPNLIGNRNVFIYAPFEAAWKNNERTHIINILDSLSCGDFQVNYVINQSADISSLYNISSFGVVVFSTHGAGGKSIVTGEIADTLLPAYQTYKPMMQGSNPKIGISKNLVISKAGAVIVRSDVYKVYDSFISALQGEFPQSIILNNSCESDKTAALRDAFLNKGAKTYYGYTESTYGAFCVPVSRDVFITLAKNGKTTGEVSKINTTYHVNPNPTFKIRGSSTMKFALSLVNGNFEDGYLGWTRNGDGRIISQLGFINPTGGNYMGIISTGLGYTTQTGRISQSFNIPANASQLNLKWNLMSEEFLEYIGSAYQDRFEIVIISEEMGEVVLMSNTIDGIAAEFGASRPSEEYPEGIPGDLVAVSPDIVFDVGGVYMTGWQAASFNISAYKGKCVTIVLRCTDVGDSIYDTVILLDDIMIN